MNFSNSISVYTHTQTHAHTHTHTHSRPSGGPQLGVSPAAAGAQEPHVREREANAAHTARVEAAVERQRAREWRRRRRQRRDITGESAVEVVALRRGGVACEAVHAGDWWTFFLGFLV